MSITTDLFAIGTGHILARIVFTTIGFRVADTTVLASAVVSTLVDLTLAINAAFTCRPTNIGAFVDFTFAIDTLGAGGTIHIGTGFDALAIGGTTEFTRCTTNGCTRSFCTLAFDAEFA